MCVFIGLQKQPERLRKKSIGRPKKGRKSVNFTVPSKGAQSSKAMRRSQSNYAKMIKTVSKEGNCMLEVYDRNQYFGLGSIPKPKPRLANTFGRYRN